MGGIKSIPRSDLKPDSGAPHLGILNRVYGYPPCTQLAYYLNQITTNAYSNKAPFQVLVVNDMARCDRQLPAYTGVNHL